MPYINQDDRHSLDYSIEALGVRIATYEDYAGKLNYSVSKMINLILNERGLNYANINALIGALECIKLELYRRVATPYEDAKIAENGDVY